MAPSGAATAVTVSARTRCRRSTEATRSSASIVWAQWTTTVRDAVTVSGLPAERIVALLTDARLPFSEIGQHRASLEEAYMELTRESVEFNTSSVAGEPS